MGSSAFTRWGGYSNVFPDGGYTTILDVYLDIDAGAGNDTRFDWSSAVSTPGCTHRRDFAFNVGFYIGTGTCAIGSGARFVMSGSNNAGRGGANPCNAGRNPITITETGWYTFVHRFTASGDALVGTLVVEGPGGVEQGSWVLSDASDVIGSTVGGNRYGQFFLQEFPVLQIDNSARM
jgi:hypothetical protein